MQPEVTAMPSIPPAHLITLYLGLCFYHEGHIFKTDPKFSILIVARFWETQKMLVGIKEGEPMLPLSIKEWL